MQFEPERMNTHIVARILVKALMAMPTPDFSLCLFLIPERVVFFFPLNFTMFCFLTYIAYRRYRRNDCSNVSDSSYYAIPSYFCQFSLCTEHS